MQKIKFLAFSSLFLSCLELHAASPVDITKAQVSEGAMAARLDSIEKGLNVLQKYVYNLSSSQLAGSQGSGNVENHINVDEIGEQFKSIRSDLENIKQEINQINDRMLKITSDVEHRLADLEGPIKEKKENAQIIDRVESQLNEIENRPDPSTQVNVDKGLTTPEEQFRNAYYLLREKNFDGARDAFEKFIKNNPNNTLIGSAHYWIGEVYTNKQEYDKAAVEYLKGYQVGATSGRAPDNLLKLAESLFKLGKRQECCVTIAKLNKEFPNISISIKRSANQLAKDAVCD
ncbi:MAG: tol-pal system protein YbgF [Candidatus Midichloria sp.]|nr:tol-pal system protein YbgF [Candidatus Midichloria sp.]